MHPCAVLLPPVFTGYGCNKIIFFLSNEGLEHKHFTVTLNGSNERKKNRYKDFVVTTVKCIRLGYRKGRNLEPVLLQDLVLVYKTTPIKLESWCNIESCWFEQNYNPAITPG